MGWGALCRITELPGEYVDGRGEEGPPAGGVEDEEGVGEVHAGGRDRRGRPIRGWEEHEGRRGSWFRTPSPGGFFQLEPLAVGKAGEGGEGGVGQHGTEGPAVAQAPGDHHQQQREPPREGVRAHPAP